MKYEVGPGPSVFSADGHRLAGFSWLCPCGDEYFGRDIGTLDEARKDHARAHRKKIADLQSCRM